jgi:hypothetical protein
LDFVVSACFSLFHEDDVLLRFFLFVRAACVSSCLLRRRKTPTHSSENKRPQRRKNSEDRVFSLFAGTRLSLVSFSNPIEKPEYSTLGAGKAHKPKQTQGV